MLRDTTSVLDTVFIALTPNGDLYRFGFLATIARIRKRPPPPDNWDCYRGVLGRAGPVVASWGTWMRHGRRRSTDGSPGQRICSR